VGGGIIVTFSSTFSDFGLKHFFLGFFFFPGGHAGLSFLHSPFFIASITMNLVKMGSFYDDVL
jgi:hypothetical protein